MSQRTPVRSIRPLRRLELVVPFALALAACAGPEHFRPAESATAESPEGWAAAQYPIIIGGNVVGEAKVWSPGAYREKTDGERRTVLHVAFALENNGQSDLWLDTDDIELVSASSHGTVIAPIKPSRISGSPNVRPGGDGEVHAYFELPPNVKPGRIDSFRVRWSVQTPNGKYAQRTPFLEQRPALNEMPGPFLYSPFYDPFLYPMPFNNQVVVVHPRAFRH